jgi:hypothetical protein
VSKTILVVVTVKSTAACTCVQNYDNIHDIKRQKLRRKRVQQCMHCKQSGLLNFSDETKLQDAGILT